MNASIFSCTTRFASGVAATLLAVTLSLPAAAASDVVCLGKANKENDFTAYFDGSVFTHIVFTDRSSGAETSVPLKAAGQNDNGRLVFKGDHPWKKVPLRVVAPQAMAPGARILLRWSDHEQKGFCKEG